MTSANDYRSIANKYEFLDWDVENVSNLLALTMENMENECDAVQRIAGTDPTAVSLGERIPMYVSSLRICSGLLFDFKKKLQAVNESLSAVMGVEG